MSKTSLQIVQSFQKLLGSGTDDWQDLISDRIVFKGPVDQVSGKQRFIELNQGFFPLVKGYEPLNAFDYGEHVCLEGTFKVSTPSGKTIDLEMAEIYSVKNGQIQTVRVYYDAEEFRKEFATK